MGIVQPHTAEALKRTASIYERVKSVIPPMEWAAFAEDVDAIHRLKKERNAIILAHNYMTPEIFYGVADIRGDSLLLAREAAKAKAEIIVQAGVHFMAETSKLLNPSSTVLIPDLKAGCSLAESIKAGRCSSLACALPWCAGRHLCQHIGGDQGGIRYLLHLRQREEDC